MLPLNLIYLRYFHDAVTCKGMSASAQKNHVTQSTISQGIQKLEKSLGLSLIVHKPNMFSLTMDGKKLFEESALIFQAIHKLEEKMKNSAKTVSGHLKIGCSHSLALALIPAHLKEMTKKYPDLHVDLSISHPNAIKEWVRIGQIDFGIVLDSEDLENFHSIELYQGRYRFYKPKGKKIPTSKGFILSESRLETNSVQEAYKSRYKKTMPIMMRVPSWELIAEMIDEEMGIGLLPDYVAARKSGLEEVDLEIKTPEYHIYAFAKDPSHLNYSAEVFLDSLKKSIQAI